MKGLYVSLITPFENDFSVDYCSLNKLLKHIFNSEINGLIVLGCTG